MYKTHIITAVLVAGYVLGLFSNGHAQAAKPNVLLILVDDMGYSDLGCYGGEISTPNINSLADKGLRYSHFYNSARCVPTRAAILSGYYAQQINRDSVLDVEGGADETRPRWARLLPTYLKRAGYRSYHSGKWHIDGKPLENGFDQSFDRADSSRFFSPLRLPEVKKKDEDQSGFYATTAIADHTIEFLQDHQETHSTEPFFSFVAFTAPHFPLQALPEDIERVGDRYQVGWDVIREQRWARLNESGLIKKADLSAVEYDLGPPYSYPDQIKLLGKDELTLPKKWASLSESQKAFQQMKMTLHAAMIERVDIEVGRILQQLKSMHSYEDTVIFFLSDNGASAEIMVRGDGHDPEAAPGSAGSYLCLGPGWSTVSNTPFRKHKTWTHEGGSCTPFIVHWPEQIAQLGELRETPGHVIDIVPTILDLAGVKPAKQKVPFPGVSLLPSFTKELGEKRTLWWSHKGNHALRDGEWKVVKVNEGEWELYNLDKDRAETKNLAVQHPELLTSLIQKWKEQVAQIRRIKEM